MNKKQLPTDVSSGVVLGLIALVVVVSLVSFVVYLELLNRLEQQPPPANPPSSVLVNGGKATGEVGITIAAPPDEGEQGTTQKTGESP